MAHFYIQNAQISQIIFAFPQQHPPLLLTLFVHPASPWAKRFEHASRKPFSCTLYLSQSKCVNQQMI